MSTTSSKRLASTDLFQSQVNKKVFQILYWIVLNKIKDSIQTLDLLAQRK